MTRPRRRRERAEESMASIAHFLLRDPEGIQRILMMRDYASRAATLPARERAGLDIAVIESFLPPMPGSAPPRRHPAPAEEVQDVDVFILTVQPIELQATLAALGIDGGPDAIRRDRPYYHEKLACTAAGLAVPPAELTVAVTAIGEAYGLHAQHAVDEIATFYRANVWILAGMAAGLPGHTRKGDVHLPKTVWWYEPGRLTADRFEPRPEVANRGPMNLQLMRFDPTGAKLHDRLASAIAELPGRHRPADLPADFEPRVSVLSDAVASGDKLLRDGEHLLNLHESNQRIVLGDQESYGFAFACRDVDWIIARGVADFGDAEKDSSYQYLATLLAVHTVLEFLESVYIPPVFAIPGQGDDEP
ncbi:hypothetical protein [Amycolatopsis eburnea]|uniref:Nucleoside phosphorylase domain-containing protein n=1 Tax=Amycolatopsis eburnea TaxID=2267691 RepID=A0A3R9DS32_9PSEU|nr:hypothetical protein [Amycolatopsis eburnea]RSD26012.1 hypothetical protein EIY87_00910 [Amycolatopsis eburnea]